MIRLIVTGPQGVTDDPESRFACHNALGALPEDPAKSLSAITLRRFTPRGIDESGGRERTCRLSGGLTPSAGGGNFEIAEERADHPSFDYHRWWEPMENTMTKRTAFGTHRGLILFFDDDPGRLCEPLKRQQGLEFYV